jgi:hypothetical protein
MINNLLAAFAGLFTIVGGLFIWVSPWMLLVYLISKPLGFFNMEWFSLTTVSVFGTPLATLVTGLILLGLGIFLALLREVLENGK